MSKQPEPLFQREARLQIVLPSGEAFEHKITEAETQIGSGPLSDVKIADSEVASTHALLAFYNDNYFVLDESGEDGTFVNGKKIAKPKKLSNGDVVKIGQTEITFMARLGSRALGSMLADVTGAVPPSVIEAIKKSEKKEQEKREKLAAMTGETGAPSVGGEEKKEKKKDKDKDKDKDKKAAKDKIDERVKAARVRAWGGIIATVLSVVLTVGISLIITQMNNRPTALGSFGGGSSAAKKLGNPADIRTISGGKFEASGAAAVPDAHGVLFVDDAKPDQILYMPVNELGVQDGPIKAIPLGVSVENPEGITQFGKQYVVVGSLSTPESNNTGGIAAFTFDPATQTVSKVAVLTGMRKFLFDHVPELKEWADKASIDGGLNVEAIAYDPNPNHPRLLLGLRGPLLNGRALVVPIKQRDPQAPLTIENLEMDEPNAIQLTLDGQAIRDMDYDARLRSFLIISGAPETEDKTTFNLWEWNGDGNQGREDARPKLQTPLDKKMKPEGIAHLKIGNQEFVFIVGDNSSYTKIDYATSP